MCLFVEDRISGTLKEDLIPFPAYTAKGSVGVDQVQLTERSVHRLAAGQEVGDREKAQCGHEQEQSGNEGLVAARDFSLPAGLHGSIAQPARQNAAKQRIVEAGETGNDCQPVEKRKITAKDEDDLER